MEEDYKEIQNLVDRLKSTNSSNNKIEILREYKDNLMICKILEYVYSPFKQYHTTSTNLKKLSHLCHSQYLGSLETMLDNLSNRVWTGHEAISYVNGLVSNYEEFSELIYSIIDKNLKTRTGADLINKAIPGCVPVFKVALATKYEPKFCDFENEEWLGSRKLDGVRCIIRKEGTNINAYSRQGNEFTTLQKVLDDVYKMPGDFILDGEICMMDKKGNEDFQGIMKQIKRKNHTIYNPKYIVFDYLTLEEFDNKLGTRKLSDRLGELITQSWGVDTTLEVLEHYGIDDDESLSDMIDEAEYQGYEGVMLRKNTGYEGKRTKNLLKCKKFFDEEYTVKGVENSIHRIILDGLEVEEEMLSNVIIEHKGCDVGVGSGFNQEERRLYFKDPNRIIGKIITVQYFEETLNQDGCHSLRFPVVKHIYENGRTV